MRGLSSDNSIVLFALSGRFVHFKSKGDMPPLSLLYLLTLPPELNKKLCIDQEPAQNTLLISKVSSHQNLFRITGHNLSTANPVTWSFGNIGKMSV